MIQHFSFTFFFLQRKFFPLRLHHQTSATKLAPLFTELRLLQGTFMIVCLREDYIKLQQKTFFPLYLCLYLLCNVFFRTPVTSSHIKWNWLGIRLAWRNSNKRVSLSFKRRGSRGAAVRRYNCYSNGFKFTSHLADFFKTFCQAYVFYLYGLVLG